MDPKEEFIEKIREIWDIAPEEVGPAEAFSMIMRMMVLLGRFPESSMLDGEFLRRAMGEMQEILDTLGLECPCGSHHETEDFTEYVLR